MTRFSSVAGESNTNRSFSCRENSADDSAWIRDSEMASTGTGNKHDPRIRVGVSKQTKDKGMPCRITMLSNGINAVESPLLLSPKGNTVLVDRWGVLAGNLARFVSIVAGHDRFRRTAIETTAAAFFVQVPLSHLLKELNLVDLAGRPAHVKNMCIFGSARDELLHKGILSLAVEGVAAGELGQVGLPGLDLQTMYAGVFAEDGNQSNLVGIRADDPIAGRQEGGEKVPGPVVVSDVVEARVGRIGGVKQGMVPVVLEVHIEIVVGIRFVVEPLQGVLVPDDVDILEENVVPEHGDHLDAIDLCGHHLLEDLVPVASCGHFGHRPKYGFDEDRGDPHFLRQVVRRLVRRKQQDVL
mmetsp:Transcript_8671/g.20706  ORF Transcript_8671/g.20706 Transcript_8671/m.20706 type:complete len:355 (+) Transcript_8671:1891-2955(+)